MQRMRHTPATAATSPAAVTPACSAGPPASPHNTNSPASMPGSRHGCGRHRPRAGVPLAVAANQAYKAGDLDRAGKLTEQAAALDPSRAGMWQQHRNDIAARRLIISARAAHAGGDHERAGQLLEDARQLDPPAPDPVGRQPCDPASHPAGPIRPPGLAAPPRKHAAPAVPGPRAARREGTAGRAMAVPAIQQVPDRAVTAAPRPAGPQPGDAASCSPVRSARTTVSGTGQRAGP